MSTQRSVIVLITRILMDPSLRPLDFADVSAILMYSRSASIFQFLTLIFTQVPQALAKNIPIHHTGPDFTILRAKVKCCHSLRVVNMQVSRD